MKIKTVFAVLAVIIGVGATARAQSSASVVRVGPEQPGYKLKKTGSTPIAVIVDIAEGYHINSNRPTDKNLIATSLKFDKLAGLTIAPVLYPKAKMQKFEFADKPLSVFEGKAILKTTLRPGAPLAAGSQTLKAKLTVQACNNQICLRPQTLDVAIPIEVTR